MKTIIGICLGFFLGALTVLSVTDDEKDAALIRALRINDSLRHQVTIYDTLYHTTFRALAAKEKVK